MLYFDKYTNGRLDELSNLKFLFNTHYFLQRHNVISPIVI